MICLIRVPPLYSLGSYLLSILYRVITSNGKSFVIGRGRLDRLDGFSFGPSRHIDLSILRIENER